MLYNSSIIKTKLGNFFLQTKNTEIVKLYTSHKSATKILNSFHKKIYIQLTLYLQNEIDFLNFSCSPQGSNFQRAVWSEIRKIDFGKRKSYLEIAKIVNSSPRAIGRACSSNPCLFFIPCHRVIRNNGLIGNYILGCQIKKKLLQNEAQF